MPSGKVRGVIMRLIDNAACAVASRHARPNTSTASMAGWVSSEYWHTASAYLTFVAIDETGRAASVQHGTWDEKRRNRESLDRSPRRLELRQDLMRMREVCRQAYE